MTDQNHYYKVDNTTKSNVETYGLTVIIIEATDYLPAFAYSIGLWQNFNHPEIVCFGLTTQTLHRLINDVADFIRAGKTIVINKKNNNFLTSLDVQFLQVDPSYLSNYFGTAINYYKTDQFPALQFVWTDKQNRFPWDIGFEAELTYRQPLLDRSTEFKFREERNLGIFTTRQWLDLKKPILRVVHDDDGDWQFLTGDQLPEDVRLVCLQDIIARDNTLNEIFNLDYGESAERKFLGDDWTRFSREDQSE